MKIAMFTNTYYPHVGGVAKSVQRLAEDCRKKGHEVRIAAPEFPDMPQHEPDVIRIPAIQNFNGSDFSMSLPSPILLKDALDDFQPEIIHAHHPYLLGDTALRVSAKRALPLVLTYHTMYEHYTHYVPTDSPKMKRFVIELASGCANLCDHIIAPSESIAEILKERGVTTPISAIPTGVDCEAYVGGNGMNVRQEAGIPDNAFVIGHVGRLAPEKNMDFLTAVIADFLRHDSDAHALIVGDGESANDMKNICDRENIQHRVHFTGIQKGEDLLDHYNAMNVFLFASKTETQGMVLAEAMAASVPVIALDAPGAREIVKDGYNGRLLQHEDRTEFVLALSEIEALSAKEYSLWQEAAHETAQRFSREASLNKVLDLYRSLLHHTGSSRGIQDGTWDAALRAVKKEWEIWSNRVTAGVEAISET